MVRLLLHFLMTLTHTTSLSQAQLPLLPWTRISSCPHHSAWIASFTLCATKQFRHVTNLRPLRPSLSTSPVNLLLLDRLSADQRSSFLQIWNRLPCHMRKISFDLHGPGWTPAVIIQLGEVRTERTCSRRPQQTSAPAPCFPVRFRFLCIALPSCLSLTTPILRLSSQRTQFWTNSSPRASSNIGHHHGRAQWL